MHMPWQKWKDSKLLLELLAGEEYIKCQLYYDGHNMNMYQILSKCMEAIIRKEEEKREKEMVQVGPS